MTERRAVALSRDIATRTGARNLCLAGGVALNCVANGEILRDGRFEGLWVQPAAGDAGGALGAACARTISMLEQARRRPRADAMRGAFLGPAYSQDEIERRLRAAGAAFELLDDDALYCRLRRGSRCRARRCMVPGPRGIRAARARQSIDPRRCRGRPEMQSTLNLKVKFRESFRPFAPAVLREDVADWFDLDTDSPYMLLVAEVAARRRIALSAADEALLGIDKLKAIRSDDSGGDARRFLGARPDGRQREQSALSPAAVDASSA